MRELPSMQTILDKMLRQADASHATHIKRITLVLGELSELDPNALQNHWNEISKNTVAENARLHFRRTLGEVQCMSCFKKYRPENGVIHCPNCGSFGAKILTGEEFYVESIEMDVE